MVFQRLTVINDILSKKFITPSVLRHARSLFSTMSGALSGAIILNSKHGTFLYLFVQNQDECPNSGVGAGGRETNSATALCEGNP